MVINRPCIGGILIILLCHSSVVMQQVVAQDHPARDASLQLESDHSVAATDSDPADTVNDLVGQLDHPSFHTRQVAAQSLLSLAVGPVDDHRWKVDDRVVDALETACTHDSLEVRFAARKLLEQIFVADHDRQIECLLNPHCKSSEIRLNQWDFFSRLAGEDMPARTAFAALTHRFGRRPTSRDHNTDVDLDLKRWGAQLDPYRLKPDDTTSWLLLLMYELQHRKSVPHLAPRIAVAMSHYPMGPVDCGDIESAALHRVIDVWVRGSGGPCGNRERLLIAMRYGRQQTASILCRQAFEDELVSPALAVTALLSASVLEHDDVAMQARRHLEDDRLAHVWQLIPSRKTKIRTEVRDVALAVLLHQRGIDPRTIGYRELQADPLLGFRDQSLGFPSDDARAEAIRLANQHLELFSAQP